MAARAYLLRTATRALTPTGGYLKGFAFSLNPYVGCAFGDSGGCPFCYVRMLPVAHGHPGAWGSWVIAKSNLAELLKRELSALKQAGKLERAAVFMSSATDPYQGLERTLRITRAALEQFVVAPPRRVLVQTRSPLVGRDLDLLLRLGDRVVVSLTLETDDEAVRRALTPTSPSVARRVATAKRLRAAGVYVQLAISPMLPNHAARLAELADGAADRVIVDTYFDGDGSSGRRSRALGMGEIYQRLSFERWFRPGAEAELVETLRARLGSERVLLSREGFSAV